MVAGEGPPTAVAYRSTCSSRDNACVVIVGDGTECKQGNGILTAQSFVLQNVHCASSQKSDGREGDQPLNHYHDLRPWRENRRISRGESRTVVDLPPFSHPFITRDSVCVTRPGKLSQNQLETSAYVVRFVPVWRARLQLM